MSRTSSAGSRSSADVQRDGGRPDGRFRPFIPGSAQLPELNAAPLVLGVLLGMVFGASSLYLVLKVGLTVSASIPVAVISVTLFRIAQLAGFRRVSILEHNIVQTAGSAGESMSMGVGVVMPAIMILGFDLELNRIIIVTLLGGLLGILIMIPLRRPLIAGQHGILKFPEGSACAEVLKSAASHEERRIAAAAGQRSDAGSAPNARIIFGGFAAGLLYKTAMNAFHAWKEVPSLLFGAPMRPAAIAAEISPELLGVGYIIGPRVASTMCAGGILAYLVLIPAIGFFGGSAGIVAPGTKPIAAMGADEIRSAYILYIGAGAVAAGGLFGMIRSFPLIIQSLRSAAGEVLARSTRSASDSGGRLDRDLPLSLVVSGVFIIAGLILAARPLHMNLTGAVLVILFSFLFVTVSARIVGEIGSTSNPVSGMTVATLVGTCLLFVAIGWTGAAYYVTALSVGGIVCIAAANGGTTSQDLKTGFLLGATPRSQQLAIIAGALSAALVLGPVLMALNRHATVYVAVSARPDAEVSAHWRVPFGNLERLPLASAEDRPAGVDDVAYRVFHKRSTELGPPGRYLVKPDGTPAWLVDPGINGSHHVRADGTEVSKFEAPKATLVSYIIKGILGGNLPWSLVLLGVVLAVILEMIGVPSLVFAVGVYLPLSSSSPIFIGGAIRWLVDRRLRRRAEREQVDEGELIASADRGPGVLLASGYIAGGAIAGIVIAFLAGVGGGWLERLPAGNTPSNPLYGGPLADILALIPFAVLALALYAAGRGRDPQGHRPQPFSLRTRSST